VSTLLRRSAAAIALAIFVGGVGLAGASPGNGAVPASSTIPASAVPQAFALFNEPGTDPTQLRGFERRLVRSAGITAATSLYAGWTPAIRASFYHISDKALAKNLVGAAIRGASVTVLLDGSNRSLGCRGKPQCLNPAYVRLKTLNTMGRPDVWMRTCDGLGPSHPTTHPGRGNGCIGQARNHNKFLMLSQGHFASPSDMSFGAPMAYNLVLQTSSNNTHASYRSALNNGLLTVNQPSVYDDYLAYFRRLAGSYDATTAPSVTQFAAQFGSHVDTSTIASHHIATWSFPQAPGHDPLLEALDNVRTSHGCTNNTAHSTGPLRNGIAVAMSRINGRTQVMRRLVRLRRSGCDVEVAFGELGAHDHHILAQGGVGLHRVCLALPRALTHITDYLHSKYVLVGGMEKRLGANLRVVYTGSENLDNTALTRTDDRLERYVEPAADSPIFDAYFANFTHLLSLSHFGHQATANCSADD
jgi:hypothetical protein